jgi:quercetin dioxygenase-like cupin family protein
MMQSYLPQSKPETLMQTATEVMSTVEFRSRDDGPAFDLLGARFLTKVSSGETDGAFCVFHMEIPSGAGVPLHFHPYPEVFYVLAGRPDFSRVHNGVEQWIATSEGETVMVPSSARHGLRNLYPRPARVLVVAGSRHQAFFDAAGVAADLCQPPAPVTEAELQRVIRIAAQHDAFTS